MFKSCYHVSYQIEGGFGDAHITVLSQLKDKNDVEEIRKWLNEKCRKTVVIFNWFELPRCTCWKSVK